MIRRSVDDKRGRPHFVNDPTQISEKINRKLRCDQRPPFLGAEDQMNYDVARGLRHYFFRPGRGLIEFPHSQGLRPGLHSSAALRLP